MADAAKNRTNPTMVVVDLCQDTNSMEITEGTRKRTRPSDGDGGSSTSTGGPDRLSALPDCILHVIMSSLKARQAVQTCVLSTRWRHLWRSVPCLDIDIVEFRTKAAAAAPAPSSGGSDSSSDSDDSDSDSVIEGWDEFEDFTVNLMLRCNIALLDSFRLDIDRGWRPQSHACCSSATQGWKYSGRQAAAWLRRAMKHCTPGPAAQRQGLLDLRPSSWRLRKLQLCQIPLDDHFSEHLTSVCRSLEDLELVSCVCKIRSITSDSLKNLALKQCKWRGFLSAIACPTLKTLEILGGSNNGGYCCNPLAISAPMVIYLRLDVDVVGFNAGISINEMPSLVRASIHLGRHKYRYLSVRSGSKLCGDQSKLLCSLSNVTSLELFGLGTTVLGNYKQPTFNEFQNLRNLLLGDCDLSDDFRILRFFRRGSPNLEKITLRRCKALSRKLDFLSDENIKLEIIHKDVNACQSAGDLPNLQGTTDAVPDAAAATATAATEDSMPHSTGVGPRRGTRCRTTSVRISGPEWE